MTNREEVMVVGTQCTSEKTLNTDSDLDWRWSRKTLLTEFGVESGDMNNTKVVDNFDIFPESLDTSSYDQRFSSYDPWKSRGAAGNSSFLDRLTWTDSFGIRVFILAKTEETQNIRIAGDFPTFPKSGNLHIFISDEEILSRRS
jgi:hypothetical protein